MTLHNNIYSASLTGEPFLFYEIRQVAKLIINGFDQEKIRYEVMNNNIFQYDTEKSVPKRFTAINRRLMVLDEREIYFLAEKPSETAKIINLYAIMKSNRLLSEFIFEVLAEKFENHNYFLEKLDLIGYFNSKKEQNETVAAWKDYTFVKLRQVFLRILFEVGILESSKSGKLQKLSLDREVIDYFQLNGNINYLNAMGINI